MTVDAWTRPIVHPYFYDFVVMELYIQNDAFHNKPQLVDAAFAELTTHTLLDGTYWFIKLPVIRVVFAGKLSYYVQNRLLDLANLHTPNAV